MKQPAEQSNEEWMADFNGRPENQRPSKSKTSLTPIRDDNDDAILDGDPLIPEGIYTVIYQSHSTATMGGRGKLIIEFAIEKGSHKDVKLRAFFNVDLLGRPGPSGKFSAGRNGNYYEQICDVLPELIKSRTDRISPRRLFGKRIRAEVITVKTKWNGADRKLHTQYSKINTLLGIDPL